MTEDATLERFGDDDVDGAAVTVEWSPEGRPCDGCATPVERRWRSGDRFLCADCKQWE